MTRDDIIEMAREANIHVAENNSFADDVYISVLYRFATLVAAAQREKDAQICESVAMKVSDHKAIGAEDCAAAIRERGQEPPR